MMEIKHLFGLLGKKEKESGRRTEEMEKTKEVKKKKFCIDGIALLSLAKTGIIETAVDFYDIVLVPSLIEEIESQKKENEPEALYISKLIKEEKFLKEHVYKNDDLKLYGLFGVELEVVSHFLNGNCDFILSDDAIIRENREILKLNVVSTPAFILSLINKGIITKEKGISAYAILRNDKWFEEWIIDECIRRVKTCNTLNTLNEI